jgi:hypothetical protein
MASSDQKRKDGRDEEEDAVHDSKGKCSLQHGAVLVGIDAEAVDAQAACGSADVQDVSSSRHVCAVPASSIAEGVDCANEGADEEEIDKCNKVRVVAGAVVREESCDRPGCAEDRDDEEDEDVIGRQGVLLAIHVHEVCEHTKGWDLFMFVSEMSHGAQGWFVLTSVTISQMRQKAKKIPKSILMLCVGYWRKLVKSTWGW